MQSMATLAWTWHPALTHHAHVIKEQRSGVFLGVERVWR